MCDIIIIIFFLFCSLFIIMFIMQHMRWSNRWGFLNLLLFSLSLYMFLYSAACCVLWSTVGNWTVEFHLSVKPHPKQWLHGRRGAIVWTNIILFFENCLDCSVHDISFFCCPLYVWVMNNVLISGVSQKCFCEHNISFCFTSHYLCPLF